MDAADRKDLIARYRAGFDQVAKALEGFPADKLAPAVGARLPSAS